ncbi:MAG: CotH kinase family protein [Opitutaceae bacterium]|nr:CotH kinase family protein [Verrucomicrobiales bacterium]
MKSFPAAPLFDPETLRTAFLEFENADWEKELADFYNTDVEVPAKLTVDGKTYPDVGVHFRGASSYFTVREGLKHSLSISMDFVKEDQRLGGYRTLNLLNSHGDPTYLRAVLYYQVARDYIPAPKANFMRVVINGESWGIYPNVQHFDKDLINDGFKTTQGARWKVPGSPRGQGGLGYLGEDPALYKGNYEIKSKDEPKAWADLIKLCRVLNQTPPDKLEVALAPLLDIDGALKFLALENVFINNDGYWIRTSDYSIYQDEKGRFHVIPHDANETFGLPGGPGFGGGPRIEGPKLDPLFGADDPNKPLISKLLAVPALKARYLGYVRDMAERWLDWKKLGPLAQTYQALISADVKVDTRKLDSFEAFTRGVTADVEGEGMRGPQRQIALKNFADQRRAFLLQHPEVSKATVAADVKSK